MRVDDGVLDQMRVYSGAISLVVRTADTAAAAAALRRARAQIGKIRHPEQPDEPFASWIGPLDVTSDQVTLLLDMADAEAYEGILERTLEIVVDCLAGIPDAHLTFPPPGPAPAREPLEPWDISFPIPPAAVAVRQRLHHRTASVECSLLTTDEGIADYYRCALTEAGYSCTVVPKTFGLPGTVVRFENDNVSGRFAITDYPPSATVAHLIDLHAERSED